MFERFWTNLKWKVRHDWNPAIWVPATILCIRFPFLYGRNRFTGKHYTNWKLWKLQRDAHDKAYKSVGEFGNKENPWRQEKVSNWWAFVEKFYSAIESFLGLFHIIPTYTELDGMPRGWKKAFGVQFCKELKAALLEEGGGRKRLRQYGLDQVKEKFGALCWYDHGGNEQTDKVVAKYEFISEHTCIVCGKPADYITRGWIEPYCKDHLPEHIDSEDEEQVSVFYTKQNPWYGHYRITFDDKKQQKDEEDNA